MALKNNEEQGNKIFLKVVGGKIAQKVSEGTLGAVARTNKNGEVVHEQYYNAIEGWIESIEFKPSKEYGNSYDVTIRDTDQVYVLNMGCSGRVTNGLLGRIPNIDLDSKMEFRVFTIKDKVTLKDKQYSSVYQNGVKVEPFYTKDTPNGLPPMVQVKVKGELVWDDSDQIEFLRKMVEGVFASRKNKPANVEVAQSADTAADASSDLPF
jgi:hypothetical protein